jgi:hypothetical protein
VPHVEQELLSLPGHLSSLPVFNEVRIIFFFFQTVCLDNANESFWIANLENKNNLHSNEKDLKEFC